MSRASSKMRIKWDALHVQIMAVKAAHPEWTNKQVGAAVGVSKGTAYQYIAKQAQCDAYPPESDKRWDGVPIRFVRFKENL